MAARRGTRYLETQPARPDDAAADALPRVYRRSAGGGAAGGFAITPDLLMPDHCLSCYAPLTERGARDYHYRCARRLFGSSRLPALDLDGARLEQLAQRLVTAGIALTGVQPKLSLMLRAATANEKYCFTIVPERAGRHFILKPQIDRFPHLPENEDLTMHLAGQAGLPVAQHTLVRLTDGALAYLTWRFDRPEADGALRLEDMAQLTERPAEEKYRGAMEQVGKVISRYATFAPLEQAAFFRLTVFCFLTGNADMHLKNFSLLTAADDLTRLAPAYDLVATKLAMPSDPEEMALTLNGKKSRLKLHDFTALANALQLPGAARLSLLADLWRAEPAWRKRIDSSFLPEELKENYQKLLAERLARLAMSE